MSSVANRRHPQRSAATSMQPIAMASSQTEPNHYANLDKNHLADEALPELSFDIITEILSWLPVKSLLRFKCVCKQWHSLLQDSKFITSHMARARPLQLSVLTKWQQPSSSMTIYDQFYDANFKYVQCGAGLILEKSVTSSQVLRIRNFATHQVVYLPHLPHEGENNYDRRIGLVLSPSTGDCKVACLHMKPDEPIKILTVGKDDQWRTLKLPKKNNEIVHSCYRTIKSTDNLEEGAAQVVQFIRVGQEWRVKVQSLDLWSERFTDTMLHKEAFLDLTNVKVIRWNHRIAVVDIIEETLHVWELENYKEGKWCNVIVPLKFLKDIPCEIDQVRPHCAWLGVLYLHNVVGNNLITYGLETGEVKGVIKKTGVEKSSVDFRKPSLVTLKGMKNED